MFTKIQKYYMRMNIHVKALMIMMMIILQYKWTWLTEETNFCSTWCCSWSHKWIFSQVSTFCPVWCFSYCVFKTCSFHACKIRMCAALTHHKHMNQCNSKPDPLYYLEFHSHNEIRMNSFLCLRSSYF